MLYACLIGEHPDAMKRVKPRSERSAGADSLETLQGEGLQQHVLEGSTPAEGREGLAVALLVLANVQEATQKGRPLALVYGNAKSERERQLRPNAAALGVSIGPSPAAAMSCRWLVVGGVYGGYGDDVAKIHHPPPHDLSSGSLKYCSPL